MDIPWVHLIWGKYYATGRLPSQARFGSFWCRDVLKLVNSFKGLAKVSVGDGSSCFLWISGVVKYWKILCHSSFPMLRTKIFPYNKHVKPSLFKISSICLCQLRAISSFKL